MGYVFEYMAYVGPEWSYGMTYNDTRHTNVANEEVPDLELTDDEDVSLLSGEDYDILV